MNKLARREIVKIGRRYYFKDVRMKQYRYLHMFWSYKEDKPPIDFSQEIQEETLTEQQQEIAYQNSLK